MSRRVVASILIALWLCAAGARAEVVPDLYAASVPVGDQGEAALAAGARKALAEVIVKVSGSPSALDNPAVGAALANARAEVQQYAFSRDDSSESGLAARFEFDRGYISDLLTSAGLPLWTANRPRVLVWMAVETDGQRQFVNPADTPELAAGLMQAFRRRGVPAQFPLYDLGDATALGLDDVWQQQAAAVQDASARYGVEDILMGRVAEDSTGRWVGDWSYLHGLDRRDRSASTDSAQEFFGAGVGLVADDMVARYAVTPSGAGQDRVQLGVSGVEGFADYAAIVNWLQGLELVSDANVTRVSGDRVEFTLVASADAARLAQIIQLNQHLQPLDPSGQNLEYRWQN